MLKRVEAAKSPLKRWKWARWYRLAPSCGDPQREPRADLSRSIRKTWSRMRGGPLQTASTTEYFLGVLGSRLLYSSSRPLSPSWLCVVYWRIGREVSIYLLICTLLVPDHSAFSILDRIADVRNRHNNIRRRTCGHSPSSRVSKPFNNWG